MSNKPALHKLITRMSMRSSSVTDVATCYTTMFNELPVEIVLEILAYVAASSQRNARNIALLCTWTLPLAREALYRTVVLSGTRQADAFLRTLGADRPGMANVHQIKVFLRLRPLGRNDKTAKGAADSDLGSLVTNLWLPPPIDTLRYLGLKDIDYLFDSCRKLRRVAVPGCYLRALLRSRARSTSKKDDEDEIITDLTVNMAAFRYDWTAYIGTENGHSFLNNLTHLWILDMAQSSYLPMKFLRNLTHLAIPLRMDDVDEDDSAGDTDKGPSEPFRASNVYLSHGAISMLVYHVSEKMVRPLQQFWQRRSHMANEFSEIAKTVHGCDSRVYMVELWNGDTCSLWQTYTRVGCGSIWEVALQSVFASGKPQGEVNVPATRDNSINTAT